MALTSSVQTQIAFKNILGKSQTDSSKSLLEETIGFSFNVPSTSVYMDILPQTASTAVVQGLAVGVSASLSVITGTNFRAYQTYWPNIPPSGIDTKTGLTFAYGIGSLTGVTGGQKLDNLISDSNGVSYTAIPYDGSNNRIFPLSNRDWIYQYSSGVYYQQNTNISGTPSRIDVYAYIGAKLSDFSEKTFENIRISATGINSYYATYSTPIISTYSTNYLYLVDFGISNTSGTVSLNINNIGTVSVIKYLDGVATNLSVGDLVGATGSNQGETYYLLFRNNQFEFFDKYPVSDSNKFTTPKDLIVDREGIKKGTSFGGVDFVDVWNQLLYPEEQGSILGLTCFGPTSSTLLQKYEVGSSFSTVGTFTFSFTMLNSFKLKPNTFQVRDIDYATIFTQSSSFTGGVGTFRFPSGYTNYIKTSPGETRLKVSVNRNDNIVLSEHYYLTWMWKIYYGSSTYSSLTASQILSLDSILATHSMGNFTVSGSGYKYFIVPDDSSYDFSRINYNGLPLAIAGTTSGYTYSTGDLNYTYMSFTNSYNLSKQYKIFRTQNQISATISIHIN